MDKIENPGDKRPADGRRTEAQTPESAASQNYEASRKILERLLAKGPKKMPLKTEEKRISAEELSRRLERDKAAMRETVEKLRNLRGAPEK